MATISKTILPIPESIVVGSGGYTVPSNKYGFLVGTAAVDAVGVPGAANYTASSSAAVAEIHQWLPAGTTISVTGTSASASGITSQTYSRSTATISLNGTAAAGSRAAAFSTGYSTATGSISGGYTIGWSVALFPIPVNNLPASLIT